MTGQDLILAIDAGTSSLRAALFRPDGTLVRQRSAPLALVLEGDRAEIDPTAILTALRRTVIDLEIPATGVGAIGVTAALGLVLVDGTGVAQGPVLSWQDRRAGAEARAIASRIGAARLHRLTGRPADAELMGPKLAWLLHHQPERLAAAAHALPLKDWLVLLLCGAAATDETGASYSLLYDLAAGTWSAEVLEASGVPARLLPPVRHATDIAGVLSRAGAALTGLRAGTPVVVGCPDGTAGAIGGGMVAPGIAVDVMGTTDVVFACSAGQPSQGTDRLVVNRYPARGGWSTGGPMGATGGAIVWLAGILGRPVAELTQAARAVPPGAEGLMMSPCLGGARTPRWSPSERAGIAGLGFHHGPGHLFRAALEGCAFGVAEVFDALDRQGVVVEEIRAVGGSAANGLWLDIRAAVLNRPLIVPEVTEASALGTAMLAAVGTGLMPDLETASRKMVRLRHRVEPDPDWASYYAAAAVRFAAFRDGLPQPGLQ